MKLITKNVGIFAVALVAVSLTGLFAVINESQGTLIEAQSATVYGHVTATVHDADGNVKQYMQTDNVIVNNGLDSLAINTFSPSAAWTGGINGSLAAVTHMQVGLGTTQLGATANALGTAIATCTPDTFTASGAAASAGVATVTLQGIFDVAGDGAGCQDTLGEAGLFDSSSGSGVTSMFAQNAFSPSVALGASDQLQVDWTFTFTDT